MAALLPLVRHATRAAPTAPDAELLARFADRRDEDAFAELVRRHGPVVFRVCSRLVGPSSAEDAFQAVFLVLATRLRAASAAPSVGGWLVGVAGRVARQMRRSARRRARHEAAAAESRTTECADRASDLADQFRALDEELARLPDHLRDPVVLCLLQGHTQEEAASELGRDARTLRRRLDRAKHVLRARLERRGVLPAVAGALLVGAASVSATVPSDLAPRTVATVFDFLTGGTAAAGSAPVVLAKGVATTMIARKLTHLTVAVAAGLIGLGAVLAGDGPPVPAPTPATAALPAPQPTPTPAPAAKPLTPTAPPVLAHEPERPLDWAKDEAQARKRLEEFRTSAERVVVLDAMCVRVPAGFCERAGLTAEESVKNAWALTARERRMFTSLLRAEPDKQIVNRPMMATTEGRVTGVNTTQQVPVVTGFEAKTKDGKPVLLDGIPVYTRKVSMVETGVSLRITPKIAGDGMLQLRVEAESSEVGALVKLATNSDNGVADAVYVPATNKQALQTTAIVQDGGAVVISGGRTATADGTTAYETLWVVTPYAVRGEKKPAAGGPAAPPVAPPVRR